MIGLGAAVCAQADPLPRPLRDTDFPVVDPAQAKLGQLLFYDKILSGNRNISCGTCHHHKLASGDGLSLGIGEGGTGLGTDRTPGEGDNRIPKRIPRNAPALWNLGAKELHVMFHDGRLERSALYGNGFDSPAEEWLPQGLPSLLAAQALFPLTAQFEMAGNPRENEVAGAVHDQINKAWPILAKRVRGIPEYGAAFVAAFDRIDRPEQVTIVEIATALAAFMDSEWRSFDSPFDAYLNGNTQALTDDQQAGMALFFGKARCASCHNGPLLSDQKFHALALPPFGPGRTRPFDPVARDVGRMGKSNRLEDAYRFRTPMLRNVALTGPYGHNGAYATLRGMVEHHMDPIGALARWTLDLAHLPDVPWLAVGDGLALDNRLEMERVRAAVDILPLTLSARETDQILAFLDGLTGVAVGDRPLGVPPTVPSGLLVDN